MDLPDGSLESVELRGHRIAFEQHGDGTPVVFIHGTSTYRRCTATSSERWVVGTAASGTTVEASPPPVVPRVVALNPPRRHVYDARGLLPQASSGRTPDNRRSGRLPPAVGAHERSDVGVIAYRDAVLAVELESSVLHFDEPVRFSINACGASLSTQGWRAARQVEAASGEPVPRHEDIPAA